MPSSPEFAEAVRLGMGWGMVPSGWAEQELASGRLVIVTRRPYHDVPLHWLVWRLPSRSLEVLTRCVKEAAATSLEPYGSDAA